MSISVIIPTYNSEKYIEEALASVYQQSVAALEVICVDDASSDRTVDIIKARFPEVKILLNEKNGGPSVCRNRGLSMARGELIAFLDADDYWMPDKTQWQLELLTNDPALDIACGLAQIFLMPESLMRRERMWIDKPHFNCYVSAMLIRKSVFDAIGSFHEGMRLSEDQDWLFRARESGVGIKLVERTAFMRRIHEQNISKGHTIKTLGIMDAIKKSLDRRRQTGDLESLKPIKRE